MTFSNLLAQLIIPLNLSVSLLILALLMRLIRLNKTAYALLISGTVWGVMWALPITSLCLGGLLEQHYPHRAPADYPQAQAIVVLGGHTAGGRSNWFDAYDPDARITRSDTAATLYHAARAPLVLASGAALDGGVSEAQTMANALQQDHVPATAIVLETRSQNTRENAVFSRQELAALGINNILLVTSALHMPRALATFKKLGLDATAAPSPPQIIPPDEPGFSVWLPNHRAFSASRSIIKEFAALLLYRLRGWL